MISRKKKSRAAAYRWTRKALASFWNFTKMYQACDEIESMLMQRLKTSSIVETKEPKTSKEHIPVLGRKKDLLRGSSVGNFLSARNL
jgi:hypothetical protein